MARILIAEDEESTRLLLEQCLCNSPHEITLVGDGTDALKAYGQALRDFKPFTLLVLDCSMPRMSGPQALKRVRELGDHTTLAVFLTAHAKEVIVEDVIDLEVFDIWEKPQALINLEERITGLLKSQVKEAEGCDATS